MEERRRAGHQCLRRNPDRFFQFLRAECFFSSWQQRDAFWAGFGPPLLDCCAKPSVSLLRFAPSTGRSQPIKAFPRGYPRGKAFIGCERPVDGANRKRLTEGLAQQSSKGGPNPAQNASRCCHDEKKHSARKN